MNKPKRSIVLVGMMGAGKSAVARALAQRMHLPFMDSDTEIERRAGKTIRALFEDDGEPVFRQLEKEVLRDLLHAKPMIIATGGGAVMQAETRRLLKDLAIGVWLKADIQTLYERVKKDKNRPLLKEKNAKKVLAELLDKRKDFYAQSPIHIENGQGTLEEVVEAIIEAVRKSHHDA